MSDLIPELFVIIVVLVLVGFVLAHMRRSIEYHRRTQQALKKILEQLEKR